MLGTINKVSKPYEVLLSKINIIVMKQDIHYSKGNFEQERTVTLGKNKDPYQVGDMFEFTDRHITDRFISRLAKIGIDIDLGGNYPWIYLDKINGTKVEGIFMANHGFTAFMLGKNGICKFTDRKVVFNKVRSMLGEINELSRL